MRVLFAASECVPFVKTGGLADVVGELPGYLNKEGVETIVVLPKYCSIPQKYLDLMQYEKYYFVRMGGVDQYVGVFRLVLNGTSFYFLDNETFFKRDSIYGYDDDPQRFAYFALAVAGFVREMNLDLDVIHAHDWHSAMVPVVIKEKYWDDPRFNKIKFVVTIHNPLYQGLCDKYYLSDLFGIPMHKYYDGSNRFKNCLSYLKSGLVYADKITTVSPTHSQELLTPEFGCGLESVLQYRRGIVEGILNGIDYDTYNPATDKLIHKTYSKYGPRKAENKKYLQNYFGLEEAPNKPLLGLVSRFAWQKGMDLIIDSMEQLVHEGYQMVFLGNGEPGYESAVINLRNKYPQSIGVYIGYSNEMAHKIYAGSDMYLMPSYLEPCGISQMIAMRYGSIPVVRQVGGLKDSVIAYNEYTGVGTGFGFRNANRDEFMNILRYAKSFYEQPRVWKNIVDQALQADYSWSASSKKYKEMYENLCK